MGDSVCVLLAAAVGPGALGECCSIFSLLTHVVLRKLKEEAIQIRGETLY